MTELPQSLREQINLEDPTNVTFIIALKESSHSLQDEIQQSISTWVESHRTIVFLNHIDTIISDQIQLTRTQPKELAQCYQTQELTRELLEKLAPFYLMKTCLKTPENTCTKLWLKYKTDVALSPDDREKILGLSSLHAKYHSKHSVRIELAYEHEPPNRVTPLKPGKGPTTFVTLPTEIHNFNFSFLLNTQLVLSANRKELGDNKDCITWNTIVLKHVFLEQLTVLALLFHLARENRKLLISLLALPPTDTTTNIHSKEIEDAFYPALDSTPILLAEDKSSILTPLTAQYDPTGFIDKFGRIHDKPRYVSRTVSHQARLSNLERYKRNRITWADIAKIIASPEFETIINTPAIHIEFLNFLNKYPTLLEHSYNIRSSKIILTSTNTLLKPSAVYFRSTVFNNCFASEKSALEIPLVHPDIDTRELRALLAQLGVTTLTFATMIQYANRSKQYAVMLLQRLFEWHQAQSLPIDIITNVNTSLQYAVQGRDSTTRENLYFSSAMNPVDSLESYFPTSRIGYIDIDAYNSDAALRPQSVHFLMLSKSHHLSICHHLTIILNCQKHFPAPR